MPYFSSTYWLVPVTTIQGQCPTVDTLSLTASEVIDLCAIEAEDVSKVTYTEAHWILYLNQAVRALVVARPESAMRIASIQLSSGTRQILPSGYERLMAIPRNMGSDGVTPGSAVQGPKPMEHMDLLAPTWHSDTAGAEVTEYFYDPSRPKVFYVNPPVASTPALYVEAHLVYPPVPITATTDTVGVDSMYSVALMEYMLYLAFARDHESSPNFARSGAHLDRFLALTGLKEQGELKVTPHELESR